MATKLILVRNRAFVSVIPAYAGIHLLEPMHNANLDAGFRRHDGSGLYLMRALVEAARIFRKLAKEVLWN
jgi:hypothetical protein